MWRWRKIHPFGKVHSCVNVQVLINIGKYASKGGIIEKLVGEGHVDWMWLLWLESGRSARAGRV